MMHAREILIFDRDLPKEEIQRKCNEWAKQKCDPNRATRQIGGFPGKINFTYLLFDTKDDAIEFLEGSPRRYKQTAVQFKVTPKNGTKTKEMIGLEGKIAKYNEKIQKLDEPHYKDVKVKTVTCKNCGSSLATEYCGTSWYNKCIVCKAELRPAYILNKIDNYNKKIKELKEKLKTAKLKIQKNDKYKVKVYWAVAIEAYY